MYGPEAAGYERVWAPVLHELSVALLDRLDLRDAERVLDVGCGVGMLLPVIAERAPGAQVVGIDLTQGMIRRADTRFGRAIMDVQVMGFAEGSFDAAVCAFMLFHLSDPMAGLINVRRSLHVGGAFGCTTWGVRTLGAALSVWNDELDALGAAPDPAGAGPPGGEPLVDSAEKMSAILADAGFEDISVETVAWERTWRPEEYLAWRSATGPTHRRLGTLPRESRDICVARVTERFEELSTSDFVSGAEVIMSTARRPR
jgi:SAM-dependent methyltransferase